MHFAYPILCAMHLRLGCTTVLLCASSGAAHAAQAAPPVSASSTAGTPAAAASTTLDICIDQASGNWRYTGVVSVRHGATDASVLRIGYWVQNRVSGIAWTDAVEALPLGDAIPPQRQMASRVLAYGLDGPPLPLGALRNIARISLYDPANAAAPAVKVESTYPVTAAICACATARGCVRSVDQWQTTAGPSSKAWAAPYRHKAWQMLSQQIKAALLNKARGATMPAGVQATVDSASAWLAAGAGPDSCSGARCETPLTWTGILETYNHGDYPGAPPACSH